MHTKPPLVGRRGSIPNMTTIQMWNVKWHDTIWRDTILAVHVDLQVWSRFIPTIRSNLGQNPSRLSPNLPRKVQHCLFSGHKATELFGGEAKMWINQRLNCLITTVHLIRHVHCSFAEKRFCHIFFGFEILRQKCLRSLHVMVTLPALSPRAFCSFS